MARRYGEHAKQILTSLAQAGGFILAANSPYFGIQLWKHILKLKTPYEEHMEELKKFSMALRRLKQSRLVLISEKEDGAFVTELTEQGRRRVREFQFADLKIKKLKVWDKIWRMVAFDIPNTKNKARGALRSKLKYLGFYQIQKSIWVFPYPCEQEIEFLVELFGVYPYVHLMEVRKIKNDSKLKRHFHLL